MRSSSSSRRHFMRRALGGGIAGWHSIAAGFPAGPRGLDCHHHLRAIFDAVAAWRRKHRDLPPRLTDLVTGGFIDRRLLICPVLARNGLNRPGNPNIVSSVPGDPLTRYQWEFTPKEAARHWKQRLIGAGDWVPMARCDQHPDSLGNSYLNLALNGAVYPSGDYWEPQLRNLIPFPYLSSVRILGGDPVVPLRKRIPGRAPGSTARQLDLEPVFNGAFTDPWPEGYDGEEAPEIAALGGARRLWEHNGTVFEIRGVVQLEGTGAAKSHPETIEPRFPFSMRSVNWDVETACPHLLCGVIREQPGGTPAAAVSVRTDSGEDLRLELRHGVHVIHGRALPASGGAVTAWSRREAGSQPDYPKTAALSLSHVVWPLGRRVRIQKLEFTAMDSACYPLLCAVTAE